MKAKAGFTLTELLAVIGIGLILVAGSVSILVALSGHIGPRQAVSAVQSMLNGARFHAVSDQVKAAAVVFESEKLDPDDEHSEHGTKLSIWVARQTSGWEPVPGAEETLPAGIFVASMPSGLSSIPRPAEGNVEGWQLYREALAKKIHREDFSVLFGPTGVMLDDVTGSGGLPADPIPASQVALVVFRVTASDEVGDFVFYPLNVNTGTRLVFE